MLALLKVENLALIKSLSLSFGPGANILTGETGAGKSILAGAIGLIRGSKASSDMVRSGSEEARVEAQFSLENPEKLSPLFREQGLEISDEIIIQRHVLSSGRNRIRLNGALITLAQLSAWGEELLAISSQHDQQTLTSPARQCDFLDAFGKHQELLLAMARAHRDRENFSQELSKIQAELTGASEKRELWEFQLSEIEACAPEPEEDLLLLEQKNRAKSGAKLSQLLSQALAGFFGEDGLLSRSEKVRHALSKASDLDGELTGASETLAAAAREISDCASFVKSYSYSLSGEKRDMEEIDSRLSDLTRLKRKYGPSLEEVFKKMESLKDSLNRLDTANLEAMDLMKKLSAASLKAAEAALALHKARLEAGKKLAKQLKGTLKVLGFPKIELEVECLLPFSEDKEKLGEAAGPKGASQVNFLFCPNPGEGLKPISRIASGGELSRVMLALKTAQEPRSDQCLVFDEIDSGLSGATAEAVAKKMAELSSRQQVFVITHQPIMAALPGCHFLAAKFPVPGEDRTVTQIKELEPESRLDEIARMLDGANPSPQAMALSKRLLGQE
jgi:DNA repair protein RecN (Recombination protein N)